MSWEAAEERGREQLREWGMQGAAEGIGQEGAKGIGYGAAEAIGQGAAEGGGQGAADGMRYEAGTGGAVCKGATPSVEQPGGRGFKPRLRSLLDQEISIYSSPL